MKFECCVCDLDGTLLNSNMEISEESVKAIQQLQECGITVILATGRNDLYVKALAKQIGVSAPIISCNGSLIREQSTGEVIYSRHLPCDHDRTMVEYCIRRGYDFTVSTYDCIYCRPDSKRVQLFHQYNNKVDPEFRVPLKELTQAEELPLGSLLKLFIWRLSAEQVRKFEGQHNRAGLLSIVSSEKDGLDIMPQGVSKGAALQYFANRQGIDLAHTMVFGDNYNDISMMELAGLPIAVANAEQAVKQAAKYVTLSNDEDGVAHAIRKYILT
ncbi:hypothetical protein P22_2664 [Propionispora sp. 2/2-37]|uniref:Cof-type HAD-IIB family hydrolase n=1 Tax=Propionispora sp. 2/2-37 TaxID=1677858 RepID=UPI0006BB6913|nr:Cof-type HAD-IIB family hydrolase [Propionispora sp. 2/2-37]CUH96574.1 hypothetical protein P22_2664 [Propionispora sp. 2/2-37]